MTDNPPPPADELHVRIYAARKIPETSWLRHPRYAWFIRCHEYASCKTNAIDALSQAEPTSLYHAFGFFLRELGLDYGDEWLNQRTQESGKLVPLEQLESERAARAEAERERDEARARVAVALRVAQEGLVAPYWVHGQDGDAGEAWHDCLEDVIAELTATASPPAPSLQTPPESSAAAPAKPGRP
jgi:hypothetical protein